MIHVTFCGGSEAEMSPGGFTAFTMFGGVELRRPTLAQRILYRRANRNKTYSRWDRFMGRGKSLVITLFGGTDIIPPTVMEEYAAMRNLMQSGVVTKEECLMLIDELSAGDDCSEVSRFTMFGACEFSQQKAKKELKALDAAQDARIIDGETRRQLENAVGCPPSTAAGVVARAAMA